MWYIWKETDDWHIDDSAKCHDLKHRRILRTAACSMCVGYDDALYPNKPRFLTMSAELLGYRSPYGISIAALIMSSCVAYTHL